MTPDEEIHNPHDKLFKQGFQDPSTASAFLRLQLPEGLSRAIHWETLKLQSGNFIDSQFRHCESDLLFSAEISDSQCFIYVLFEHQSSPDAGIALRLLRYMVRIWERGQIDAAEGGKLPIIVPVVLAQNNRRWDVPENFRSLFDVPPGGDRYVPDFAFRLVQLAEIPFDKIVGTPDGILILRTFKAEASGDLLAPELWDEEAFRRASSRVFELVLRYLIAGDIDKQGFHVRVKQIQEPFLRQNAMTLAQQFIEEGRQEGRQEGRIQSLQESVIEAIDARFGAFPDELREVILSIQEESRLRDLHRAALRSRSLDELGIAF